MTTTVVIFHVNLPIRRHVMLYHAQMYPILIVEVRIQYIVSLMILLNNVWMRHVTNPSQKIK